MTEKKWVIRKLKPLARKFFIFSGTQENWLVNQFSVFLPILDSEDWWLIIYWSQAACCWIFSIFVSTWYGHQGCFLYLLICLVVSLSNLRILLNSRAHDSGWLPLLWVIKSQPHILQGNLFYIQKYSFFPDRYKGMLNNEGIFWVCIYIYNLSFPKVKAQVRSISSALRAEVLSGNCFAYITL